MLCLRRMSEECYDKWQRKSTKWFQFHTREKSFRIWSVCFRGIKLKLRTRLENQAYSLQSLSLIGLIILRTFWQFYFSQLFTTLNLQKTPSTKSGAPTSSEGFLQEGNRTKFWWLLQYANCCDWDRRWLTRLRPVIATNVQSLTLSTFTII